MDGIEKVVYAADILLKLRPAIIVAAVKGREIRSAAPDYQVEVKYAFVNSTIPSPTSELFMLEQGEPSTDGKMQDRGIDWLLYKLEGKNIGGIKASELNSSSLQELCKKYALSKDVRTQLYEDIKRRLSRPFNEGEAVLYRKNPPQPQVLGQMKLI